MESIPKINDKFTNIYGTNFDKVREVAFKKGELFDHLGHYITKTEREKSNFFDSSDDLVNGVYIYQSYNNPDIAYRIYKEFAEYGFNGYNDDKLIQNLQEYGKNIKLTDLPTGVVTLDGKIIGQEIPFYKDYLTLLEESKTNKNIKNPIHIYIDVLKILEELYKNGILYLDNHAKNFMINKLNEVKIIDFDLSYIKFDNVSKTDLIQMLNNYKRMINHLNENFNICDKVGQFKNTENFSESFDQVYEMEKKLIYK